MHTHELYLLAWKHWGADSQLDILIEEMAELTQAIIKSRREGVVFSYNFKEEIADFMICLDQIESKIKYTDIRIWDDIQKIKDRKITRLEERLVRSMESEGCSP